MITLAGMIKTDEDALVCDMMETYGVLDYRALPLHLAATLASGLRDNSRIKMRMAGQRIDTKEALIAACLDRLSLLFWANTEDGQKGRNIPPSVFEKLTETEQEDDVLAFDSMEALLLKRAEIMEHKNGGKI